MARPFAYNPSKAVISGALQIGDLAIGVSSQDYSLNPGSIKWWIGPDETTGYVICGPVPTSDRHTPVGNIGTVHFWKSSALTNASMLSLVSILSNGSVTELTGIQPWLTSNGYWSSWALLYTIGQSALGGKIAYILVEGDPGYDANVQHGLVAQSSDISEGSNWGCFGALIGTSVEIGTGNQNTIDIMSRCATAGIAARLCGDSSDGGYSDWYLPSKDELNKLYLNRVAIGGFSGNFYHSSSEIDSMNVWVEAFSSGYQGGSQKIGGLTVRAVRSF